jgi:undecaprenyl-diphosphatase
MHELLLIFAKYLIGIVGLIAFIYWLAVPRHEKVRLIIFGIIAGSATFALAKIGSALFYDPRPFVVHHVVPLYPHGADNGFPSDHTLLAAIIAITVWVSSKRLGIVLFVMALLIGLSRVIGNIHSPIDIVGSIFFALLGGVLASFLASKLFPRFVSETHE